MSLSLPLSGSNEYRSRYDNNRSIKKMTKVPNPTQTDPNSMTTDPNKTPMGLYSIFIDNGFINSGSGSNNGTRSSDSGSNNNGSGSNDNGFEYYLNNYSICIRTKVSVSIRQRSEPK